MEEKDKTIDFVFFLNFTDLAHTIHATNNKKGCSQTECNADAYTEKDEHAKSV